MEEVTLHTQQLAAHKAQQCIAREQLAALEEAAQHKEDYWQREADEKMRTLQLELCSNSLQNEQLKLEVLRWRKQCSLMRLKLASARENVQLHESNLGLLSQREQRLSSAAAILKGNLALAAQQLTDRDAANAVLQAKSAQLEGQALHASEKVTRLSKELMLLKASCASATAHNTDVQQQLTAALSDHTSLQGQLADCKAREEQAAAQAEQLQQSLQAPQGELRRGAERLAAQEKATAAAEAAAVMAAAKSEAAADALTIKEQQLAEWRELAQASKETASQQLQLSQDQMGLRETRLLDELAALRQQLLAQEKAARAAADADLNTTGAAAAAKTKSLEAQLTQLTQQLTALQWQLSAAQQQAQQQSLRADALELELEKQQEQETRTAVQAVGNIMQGLMEQEMEPQPAAAAAAAGPAAGAAAAKAGKAAAAKSRPRSAGGAARPRKAQAKAAAAIAAAAEGESEGRDEPDSSDEGDSQGEKPRPPPAAAAARKGRSKDAAAPAAKEKAGAMSPVQQCKARDCIDSVLQQLDANLQPAQQQPAVAAAKPAAAAAAAARPSGTAGDNRPAGAAAAGPPQLTFAPQSVIAPATALQKPGVMAAAHARVSATDMLKKLSAGMPQSMAGKPGARKRKLLPAAGSGTSMDVIPASLLVKPAFQAPKVRRP